MAHDLGEAASSTPAVARTATRRVRAVAKQRIMPLAYARAVIGGPKAGEQTFRDNIKARLGEDVHVIPIGRARAGLYLLVKHAIQSGRRKVLLSPFTIPDVVTMVVLAGGEPVFFDYEPRSTACELANFAALLDQDTACAIITHYHTPEPRLAEIVSLCRRAGALVFDDCAISFGGSIDGKPIGATLTDASVFSFSSFKLLNFFWGGMVTTRDAAIARAVEDAVATWPRLGARDYLAQARRCLTYDLASRPPLFDTFVFPWFQQRAETRVAPSSLENTRLDSTRFEGTLTSRPSLGAFAEWNGKLGRIEQMLRRRREVAHIYRRLVGPLMVSADWAEETFDGACFVNFPVFVSDKRRDDVRRKMMSSGFDVGASLYPNAHRDPRFAAASGKSDNVDLMVMSCVYLPTHFGVSNAYAEAIATRLLDINRSS